VLPESSPLSPLYDRPAMPSAFRDPKSLSEWIQLDYFRRPRGLRRWRSWLGWGTLVACAAGVMLVVALPRGKSAFQAGPVSAAHALFNNDCGQCHWERFQTARRILPVGASSIHAVPNQACEQCHDGPPHNAKQRDEQSCAGCHREHRGRPTLARVTDDHCTACHADLKEHSRAGADTGFENVSEFPTVHPEFRLWRDHISDPGQLHFNHEAHLKPEDVEAAERKKENLCSNCHRLDATKRYMLPIDYSAHCQRCHPLSVQLAGPFADPVLEAAARKFANEPAPHKEPTVVRAVLRERLIRFVRENPVLPTAPPPIVQAIPRPRRLEAITEQQWVWAKHQLTEAENLLFSNAQLPHNEGQLFDRAGGCAYCHVPAWNRGEIPRGPDDLPKYEPTQLPPRWLTHSRFGHDSHRMWGCIECHPAALKSRKTSDVLIPTLSETCARCHNTRVGVRNDCIECHDYHHRDENYRQSKGHTIAESLGEK
jgi:hypothetical protein